MVAIVMSVAPTAAEHHILVCIDRGARHTPAIRFSFFNEKQAADKLLREGYIEDRGGQYYLTRKGQDAL
jgi:hypothetical protein